jgi:hypothetical protein
MREATKEEEKTFWEIIHPRHEYYRLHKGWLQTDYNIYKEEKLKCKTEKDHHLVYSKLVINTVERYKKWLISMNSTN